MSEYLKDLNIELLQNTCRFWDTVTGEKQDKDRFRRNMVGEEDAYNEIMKRLMGKTI